MVHQIVSWNRAFTGLEGWLMNLPDQRLQAIFSRSQRGVQDKNVLNIYAFCYNDPLSHVDFQGETPQIVGGALVGCAAGATWSLVTSFLAKDNFCQCSCKAFGSCAVGALGGALAAANPAWGGCIAGATAGTINNFVGNGCNSLCGKGSSNVKPICAVLSGISSGILGCVIQQMGGSIGGDQLAYAMAQVVSNLVGYDVAGYCNLAAGP
jgi:hypothetical protein